MRERRYKDPELRIKLIVEAQNYRKKNPEKSRAYVKKYTEKNPEKAAARIAIRKALLNGSIIRPSNCSRCDVECVPDGHHDDYSKPLEVIWLCRRCHIEHHRKEREIERKMDT
jgi:hypothetical protein